MASRSETSRIGRDPLRLALVLLVFLTIGRAHMYFGLEAVRPGLLLVGFAIVYAVLNPSTVTDRFLGTWLGRLVPAIALVALASLPFGISPGGSAQYFLDDFSKILVTALVVLMATRGVEDTSRWILAYLAGCGMLVWYAIFVFETSSAGSLTARLSNLYTYDANDVGLLLVVGVPLCMWMFEIGSGPLKAAAVVLLSASVWSIALTGSRGAFIALGVVVVGIMMLALGRLSVVKRIAGLAVVVIALVLAAPPGYWEQMATLTSVQDDYNWNSDTGRRAIALRGVGYMLEYPVFGLGLDNFGRAEGTMSEMVANAMPGQGVPWTAPHNSYIQVAAELGIPGALVFCALVFGGLGAMFLLSRRAARRWRDPPPGPERRVILTARYLFLAYLGFATGAAFLSFAYLDLIYLLTAMGVGVLLEERRLVAEAGVAPGSPAVVTGVGGGMRGGLVLAELRSTAERSRLSGDRRLPGR